jgi:uncharacterized protein (TIGR00255 family)
MLRSMTGFGRSETMQGEKLISIEIKTVNHRYNDISIRTPRSLNPFEGRIRETVAKSISRGKIDIFIKYENNSADSIKLTFNEPLLTAYTDIFKKISVKYELKNDIGMSAISKIPDVFTVSSENETEDQIWESLYPVLSSALETLTTMRETEGLQLRNNIVDNLNGMREALESIKKRSPSLPAEYRLKLLNRIGELIGNIPVDENRIAAEVALMADRCCVDEEISRLESHFSQVVETLDGENGQIGKKLDFLTQELNREVNTIGSKANDLSITNLIVDMKCAIEKIREQVQNIE